MSKTETKTGKKCGRFQDKAELEYYNNGECATKSNNKQRKNIVLLLLSTSVGMVTLCTVYEDVYIAFLKGVSSVSTSLMTVLR